MKYSSLENTTKNEWIGGNKPIASPSTESKPTPLERLVVIQVVVAN